jgi:hypothetical protein
VQRYGYWGGGSGWGGVGPGACALWLERFPEFDRPLGEPTADMRATVAQWPGAVCDTSGGSKGNTTGCLWTRAFASGTKVFVGQFLQPEGDPSTWHRRTGSCIYWGDGSVTTGNATRCLPKTEF